MKSLSSLGIGLTVVFGCLLLALVAEIYYLLWGKKKIPNRDIEADYNSSDREFFRQFCWRSSSSISTAVLNPKQLYNTMRMTDAQTSQEFHDFPSSSLLKSNGEIGIDSEIMNLYNLSGPPRFLFTIKEETKEDLESEDGKSREERSRKGSRSLSDLLFTAETPYLTPLSSPPFFTPPRTPLHYYNQVGFNPLFESLTETETIRVWSSPPPKLKFLKDAEEKLYKKTLAEETSKTNKISDSRQESFMEAPHVGSREEDNSLITIIVGKNKEKERCFQTGSSQVLPLSSSPSNVIFTDRKKSIFH